MDPGFPRHRRHAATGSSVAATSCCFSAELQRRRRSTDVDTSTRRPFVIDYSYE